MTERRLTHADACWLVSDDEKNHHTGSALLWLDREIDPAVFRSIVRERLPDRYPTFTHRIRKSRNPLLMRIGRATQPSTSTTTSRSSRCRLR
jgi:hypothetical protein